MRDEPRRPQCDLEARMALHGIRTKELAGPRAAVIFFSGRGEERGNNWDQDGLEGTATSASLASSEAWDK